MMGVSIKQYGKTAAMQAAGYFGENSLFLVQYIMRILRLVVLLSIWRVILAGKGEVSGMSLDAVLTYTLISNVFGDQLSAVTTLPSELENGAIATRFLRPMPVFGQFISESVGSWAMNLLLFGVPLFVLAPFIGVEPLPADLTHGLWFCLSLALAVVVGFSIDLIFGSLVVVFRNGEYQLNKLRGAVTVLLSGALLPLRLLPWNIGEVFSWMPFASMASAPLQIYTGVDLPSRLVAIQIGWVVVLWPISAWIWCKQRERIVSYGG